MTGGLEGLVEVRIALPGEEHLVFALMKAAFAETARQALPSSALGEILAEVRPMLAGGQGVLALVGGRPVASGRFRFNSAESFLAYERLAVHPDARRRGLGTAMVTFLEDHARDAGVAEVRATARSQQPDNRPFYLERGYSITGYSERYGIADIRTHLAKTL